MNMKITSKICRTCLKIMSGDDNFVYINNSVESSEKYQATSSFHHKLIEFYPEINLKITPEALICSDCSASLMVSYNFKNKCKETEKRLNTYTQQNGLSKFGILNLQEVLETNIKVEPTDYIEITDDSNVSRNERTANDFELPYLEVVEYDSVLCNTTDFINNTEQYYKCNKCGYSADHKQALAFHLKAHRKREKRKCCLCTYICKTKATLRKHMQCHLEKPYQCDICDFKTKFPYSLNAHLRVHTGKRPYDCDECEYATTYKRAWDNHKKIHARITENKSCFKCSECSFVGKTKDILDDHTNSHKSQTDEAGYKCKFCVTFHTNSYVGFKTHLKMHGNHKLFKCCWCDFSTKFRNSLILHVRIHTGERPYICHKCGYSSIQAGALKRHVEQYHGKL